MQSHGEGLALNRARHELLLGASRDPNLVETSQEFVGRIIAMAHDAIAHLQPGNDDPALLEAQTTAVTTFIAGVFTRLVAGDRTINDAEQLARLLHAVVTAVALAHSTRHRQESPPPMTSPPTRTTTFRRCRPRHPVAYEPGRQLPERPTGAERRVAPCPLWWAAGVDDQRLKDPEHKFDELVEVVADDADGTPVHVEPLEQRGRVRRSAPCRR